MTQKNFVVHHGMTVGNIILDVESNSITGADVANIADLNVTNVANLGNISNIRINNGTTGQLLRSSGNGNLTWIDQANLAVAGANIVGQVANANYAQFSNVSNTANSVTLANVSGIVVNLNELWVSDWGNDTTGNGSSLNPYKTIGKAVSVAANGYVVMVRPGAYYEDVTVANLSAVTISSDVSGGAGPFTPAIYGNITVSGNSSAIAIKGIGVRNSVTHSATGSLYIASMQLGTGNTVGVLNKSGTGYLSVQDSDWSVISGANLTLSNITGSGTVLFSNVAFANLVVNNANASVTVTNGSRTLTTTLTTGTLNVFESYMYTLGNSGFYALTSSGGVVNLRNSTLVNPNLTPARINLSAGTILSYGDLYFDRANSNLGIQAGTTVDFQALRVANGVTSSTLSVSGNAKVASDTATPSGGTTGVGLTFGTTANLGVFFGSGSPTLSAAQGSLYLRTDGSSTSTRMYVNTDGSTGWTAVTTAA